MTSANASTVSLSLTGIHSKHVAWVKSSNLCFFCLDELHKYHNRHHIVPRRYFKDKSLADEGNVVRVCIHCHNAWNRQHDKPEMRLEAYLEYLASLDFGFGIFVGAE